MNINIYNPADFKINSEFQSFLRQLYSKNKNFDFFQTEYNLAYKFCIDSKHINIYPIVATVKGKIVAHVALILDDRLTQGDAFFGFFESIDETEIFDGIWKKLLSVAKTYNIKNLKGPVNGSIWHQYRCIKDNSDIPYFKTEPITQTYYYNLLIKKKPNEEILYSSGIRKSYKQILKFLDSENKLLQILEVNNFSISRKEKICPEDLFSIANISKNAFRGKSWGYVDLDGDEFFGLYDINKINTNINQLYLLHHRKKIIGYCSTIREKDILICKTICIEPKFQGKGLGNALALSIHKDAHKEGIKEIMYVLIRDGNQVHNYPTEDVDFFRKYAVFDFVI